MSLVAVIALLLHRELMRSNRQSLDFTQAALARRNGVYPVKGAWIRGGSLFINAKFALSGAVDPMRRPNPIVYYLLPCGATAPPLT